MTISLTNSSTRLAALTLAVAAFVAVAFGAAVAPAHAASVCPNTWNTSLTMGSTGADVMKLQQFLNMDASTMVASTGAGSPGMESTYFGGLTRSAVAKFQTKHGIAPAAGYFGPLTRAKVNSLCTSSTPTTPGPVVTGPGLTVVAAQQPVNSLAPAGSSRIPFTTFTLTNNSSAAVTVNSVTVQRAGLAQDAAFAGVVLLDSNGLQIGTAKTFNSNHQANIGDTGFTIGAGQSMTLTVAGNMASSLTSYTGQIASLQVVAINTGSTVSGSLPITGASQTLNSSLTVGSVSTTTSAFDPGAAQTRNIGDTAVRFSGIKFTAGSVEDLKLYSIRWRQVGSVSSADLSNVVTVANGTSYPTTVDSTGKYYTTTFPGGLVITKGNSIDVYVQGDITGSNASNRTADFDLDKVTDVYFVGQLYGYGIAPSGTYTPWYNGRITTINAGTVTTISKANSGNGAAQNIAINVNNQPLGGITTNFAGEAVSVTQTVFYISYSSGAASTRLPTSVSLVDQNGTVVAGPVDATDNGGTQSKVTFTDTITFPTGVKSYYLLAKLPTTVAGGVSVTASTTPSSDWSNPTGQTSGVTVSLSGASVVTMNSMTVKAGALQVSMSTQPASQNIVAGASQFTFASVILDATQSGEDLRLASVPVYFTGNTTLLSGCQIYDGSTALNGSSRVVNTLTGGGATSNLFSLDNTLTIAKGTSKSLAIKCNLSSAATSSSTFKFSTNTTAGDYSVTGNTSGSTITPTITASNAGTMTVQTASITLSVDSSSPASTTVSGGSTGQTIGIFKVKGSNDAVTLTKIGMTLTSGSAADVTTVYLYDSSNNLLGTANFGSGQTVATSTLTGAGLVLAQDVDTKITVKADIADVGTGKAGTEGAIIQVNPNSAEGTGTSGLVQTVGTGSVAGVRLYNSFPTFSYDTTGGNGTLNNGTQQLLALTVTADSKGDVGLYKLVFSIATTTVSVTSPTFQGPNGNVASTTIVFGSNATLLNVFFDSASNTADATVGAGTSKTYYLGGTVSGLTTTGGVVSVALKADTSANNTMAATSSLSGSNIVWSPLATTTLDRNTNDWTNGYALRAGCFASVGLATDCNARSISK